MSLHVHVYICRSLRREEVMLTSRVKEVQQHYILRECCQGGSCVGGWVGTGGDFKIKARCRITMHGFPKLGRPPTKPPLSELLNVR